MQVLDLWKYKSNIQSVLEAFVNQYNGDEIEPIKALADKIKHMTFRIGSPSSVASMLKSICSRKVKRYFKSVRCKKGYYYQHKSKAYVKIPKYMSNNEAKARNIDEWGNHEGDFLQGHFRWNYRAYMLTREHTDYINQFFFGIEGLTINSNKPSFVQTYVVIKHHNSYSVEITTPSGNQYRFVQYPDGKIVFNCNTFKLQNEHINWVNKVIKSYKKYGN
jgi:hypothetical protein